jgi:arylsulfatase
MGDRTSLTLSQGMDAIMENAFINIKNNSKTITANLELKGDDRGIILCQGGKFGGWALYMDQGKPAYTYNWFGLESYTVKSSKEIPKGSAEVKLDFEYEGGGTGKGGIATLYVNGEKVGDGRIEKTQPMVFSADETADVGKDDATQVVTTSFKNVHDSEFTGYVKQVVISIPKK